MRPTGSTRGPFCVHVFDVLARPVTLVRAHGGEVKPNDRVPFHPSVFDTLGAAAEVLRDHPFLFTGFARRQTAWVAAGPAMHAKAHLAELPCPHGWTGETEQVRLPGVP